MRAHGARLASLDYPGLYDWSVREPAQFWEAVWRFTGIRASEPYRSVLEHGDRMPGARWFEGAALNFADNLLAGGEGRSGPAIVFVSETGERAVVDWSELAARTANVAAALAALGVGRGDRVAGFMANRPETVIAMLATASLGAVWSSCSPDFGVEAVLDRFGQIGPKVLFATDGYFYNGKTIDSMPAVGRIAAGLPDLAAVVVVQYAADEPNLDALPVRALRYEALASGSAALRFTPVGFADPLYVLYSSGTTGAPKCIVHGVGGTLLQHRKEHVLHTDIHPGDVVFYFTTCGWMMWHWLVSALASGATIVLYDGAPLFPDPGSLWRLAESERVKVFGTSAKYLSALEKSGYLPGARHALGALRSVLSTGSPLAPASFDFVRNGIKDVQVASIAGGTDLISCFALGNPLLPVYRGELQCRGLGMKVEIFDESGQALAGAPGELVCTGPFPSMPIGFWNDPDGRKYRAAYFERFPNVWCHGDWAELTEHGGLIIYGRSDAVLNPGGVRIGTAEIYRIVEAFPQIAESIVVGQDWDGDTRVVLFVKLAPGAALDDALAATLRDAIRRKASPRHVPAKILAVPDIPRTMNGKIVELAVRAAIHGRPIGNRDALANPEALEHFRNRAELAE